MMADWFSPEMDLDSTIITSEKGFTNDQIAIEFLKHFIKHSNTGPHSEWKLLLMDNHGSHEIPEFLKLANENCILPYPLIPHLTHCMQPLDVGIFQPYKHWHNVAIRDSLAGLSTEYGIRSFLRDLPTIRENTFKKRTIRHAFKKSGMWPIDSKQCLKQLKTFNPPNKPKSKLSNDSNDIASLILPMLPQTPMEVEKGLGKWNKHLGPRCSSPSRPEWDSFVQGSLQVLAQSQLQEQELRIHQNRRIEELERKVSKRQRLCKYGPLTARDALRLKEEKDQKEKEAELKRQKSARDKIWRTERNIVHQQGLEARRLERERKREVKALQKANQPIPLELQVPIPDPEAIWKAEQEQEQLESQLQSYEQEEEQEVTFVTDTIGDGSLQPLEQDYIPFSLLESDNNDDSSNSSSGESGFNTDSEKDYSWERRYRD